MNNIMEPSEKNRLNRLRNKKTTSNSCRQLVGKKCLRAGRDSPRNVKKKGGNSEIQADGGLRNLDLGLILKKVTIGNVGQNWSSLRLSTEQSMHIFV